MSTTTSDEDVLRLLAVIFGLPSTVESRQANLRAKRAKRAAKSAPAVVWRTTYPPVVGRRKAPALTHDEIRDVFIPKERKRGPYEFSVDPSKLDALGPALYVDDDAPRAAGNARERATSGLDTA